MDAASLSYAWTVTKNGSTYVTGSGTNMAFVPDDNGNYVASLVVTDKDNAASNVAVTGTITVQNVAPAATITQLPASGHSPEGSQISLGSSVTDAGAADAVAGFTYAWSVTKDGNPFASATTSGFKFTPNDNGNYVVSLIATDKDLAPSPVAQATIIVDNVAPVLSISAASPTTNEGSTFTLNLAASDPGADTISQWTITWGDGAVETITGHPSSATHIYADGPATRNISATAMDEDGTYSSNVVSVSVTNVPPVLTISGGADASEGTPYVLGLASLDPGADTIASWTIQWGDGMIESIMGNPASAMHTYLDGQANVTISATATDEDGTFSANTRTVSVANVAPVLAISGAASVNEEAVYTLNLSASDPGTDAITGWTIQWGDGTSSTVADSPSSVTHVYLDGPNAFTISATASDEDATHGANSIMVTVNNVAPDLSISGAANVDEAALYTLNLSAVVHGADPIGSWTITWGDGAVQIIAGNPSTVTHNFADGPNDYTVTATTNDGDGDFAASTPVVVHVNNQPPTILSVVNNGPVTEGSAAIITVTANDPAGAADPLMYEFDCDNDGTYDIGPQSANSANCVLTDNGLRDVRVRVTDGDNGDDTDTTTVTVFNADPAATPSVPTAVNEGSSFIVALTGVSDASSADLAAGLHFAFACDGSSLSAATYASSGSTASVLCSFDDGPSDHTVRARVISLTKHIEGTAADSPAPKRG